MKTNRRQLVGGALSAGAISAFPLPAIAQGGPIRIGVITSLVGGYAAFGENHVRGAQFAVDEINAAGGINGRKLEIVEIPMPRPVVFEGRRLPASYANFYIANGIVLVPVFNDPNDRVALNTLAELFPASEIVPIYAGDLVWGFGTLHCMTQQQPPSL